MRVEIEALKKLSAGFVPLVIRQGWPGAGEVGVQGGAAAPPGAPTALIVAESPVVPRSPSSATRPIRVETGPLTGVTKPDSVMSTGRCAAGTSVDTNSKPSKTVRLRVGWAVSS